MKKTLTLMMALSLLASAFAASTFEAKPKFQPAPQQQLQKAIEPQMTIPEGMNLKQLSEVSIFPFKTHAANLDEVKNQLQVPHVRKTNNAEPTAITINGAAATFYGTYYYQVYGSYEPMWEITLTSAAKDTIYLYFIGYSEKYLEGIYKVQGGAVLKGATEVDLEGELTIAYKGTGTTTSPTYTFTADLTDKNGNAYTISGEHAFVNDLEKIVEVIDMYYLQLYAYFYSYCNAGYTQYCAYVEKAINLAMLTLEDAPVEPTTTTIPLSLEATTKRYDAGMGYWYVYSKSDNAVAVMGFYGEFDDIKGEYTEKDFYRYYTRLFYVTPDTTIAIEIYKPQSLVVTESNDTTYFNEVLLGRDGITYNISTFYAQPSSEDTITLATIAVGNYDDYTKDDGIFKTTAIGLLEDSTMALVSLAVYADKPTGIFTTKDNYSYYNYIALLGEDTAYYDAVIDTIKIIAAPQQFADKFDYVAYVTMLGKNEDDPADVHWFNLVVGMVSYYQPDAAEDVENTFDETAGDQIAFDYSKYQSNGYLMLKALKADTSAYFYGVFFPKTLVQSTILPDGEYPINNTQGENTMFASEGYDLLYDRTYPTFYYTIKDKQQDKIWFIVDGMFTADGGEMKLNGINSNGKDVTITFKRKITALNEVMGDGTKAVKAMVNGKLVIMKNGKLYNAQGAEVAE